MLELIYSVISAVISGVVVHILSKRTTEKKVSSLAKIASVQQQQLELLKNQMVQQQTVITHIARSLQSQKDSLDGILTLKQREQEWKEFRDMIQFGLNIFKQIK